MSVAWTYFCVKFTEAMYLLCLICAPVVIVNS